MFSREYIDFSEQCPWAPLRAVENSPSIRYAETLVDTRYEHIVLNKDDVPSIVGTTMKVVELVVEQRAYGWSPEELHFQHPYLTLGQIHSALAYYWDHREKLDHDMQRRLERIEGLRGEFQPSALISRLKARGME